MSKYVFIDIDGTLRHHSEGIPSSALKALKKARNNGHRLILCTGRTHGMIPSDIPLPLFDGIIAGGGCYVEYAGKILRSRHLPDNIIGTLIENFSSINAPFCLESDSTIYMSPVYELMIADGLDFNFCDKNIFSCFSSVCEYRNSPVPVSKVTFRLTSEEMQRIDFTVPDDMKLITAGQTEDGGIHMELILNDCDKGSGMEFLCSSLGIAASDTVAFGDGMNDADMFRRAGFSVCMGNAPDALKHFADAVTKDILSDGLYFGFYKAGLM